MTVPYTTPRRYLKALARIPGDRGKALSAIGDKAENFHSFTDFGF
jgi:hypothetical protein